MPPIGTVGMIARRELNAKLRTRSFVVSTVVSIVVLAGLMLAQGAFASSTNTMVVGLYGQAIAVSGQLTDAGRSLGRDIRTREVTDLVAGTDMVSGG
jgi:ABC-2 type transport system permease protein